MADRGRVPMEHDRVPAVGDAKSGADRRPEDARPSPHV